MDRDGTRIGYDIPLTRTISEAVTIPVIASGGVGTLEHLYEGLVDGKADAVLAASIFHYREHTVLDAKKYLRARRGGKAVGAACEGSGSMRAAANCANPVEEESEMEKISAMRIKWDSPGAHPRGRPGRADARRGDGCLYECGSPGADAQDGAGPLLFPLPKQAVAQGRDLGPLPGSARPLSSTATEIRSCFVVDQKVAACHTGYWSCFYRSWRDGWKEVGEKVFDEEAVYTVTRDRVCLSGLPPAATRATCPLRRERGHPPSPASSSTSSPSFNHPCRHRAPRSFSAFLPSSG